MTIATALIQCIAGKDKAKNLDSARSMISGAVGRGAQLVVLPECFQGEYAVKQFAANAEPASPGHPTYDMLCETSKDHGITLVGGSFIERGADDALFNTCCVFEDGELLGVHRKLHMFDVDIPGGIRFRESSVLTPGDSPTVIQSPRLGITLGVGICFDVRFAEYADYLRRHGADVLVYPGAFNLTTGPAHWTLLGRARALDAQAYTLLVSPARNPSSSYKAYGHTLAVDPYGAVLQELGHEQGTVELEINADRVADVRRMVPLAGKRRAW